MDSFVLTLAEARVMYRRYHSLLEKGRKRLPGGANSGGSWVLPCADPEQARRRNVVGFFWHSPFISWEGALRTGFSPSGFLLRVFSHRAKISPCTTGFRQNAGNPSEGRGCGRRRRMGWFF